MRSAGAGLVGNASAPTLLGCAARNGEEGHMPRALLVDDDANSLEALAELINQEGFTTSTASTLGEARQLMEEITPAVVLTDLMLPDGSGLELVEISGTIG